MKLKERSPEDFAEYWNSVVVPAVPGSEHPQARIKRLVREALERIAAEKCLPFGSNSKRSSA
jgi:hypothetical protein